jgi:hypothetical protein
MVLNKNDALRDCNNAVPRRATRTTKAPHHTAIRYTLS